MFEPAIIVHGGAGTHPSEWKKREPYLAGVKDATLQGHAKLARGGSALDAVEAAVIALENNPLFNTGHGSVLNLKGNVEMDAIVIDGRTLSSGAVCGVRGCPNPVRVARLVMEKTNHCLLTGEGAQDFMESQGILPVPDSQLIVPGMRLAWEKAVLTDKASSLPAASQRTASDLPPGCDTVGAVAMDAHGNVAAATSTGGTTAKLPGRVGDSPIIGAGAYADSSVGAISTTGDGESIMKVCLARRTAELLETGVPAQESAARALRFMHEKVGGEAGIIVLAKDGNRCHVARHFISTTMPWVAVNNGCITWGIDQGQEESASLE